MILKYSEDPAAEEMLRSCMPGHPSETVVSRETVEETLDNASVAVLALPVIGRAESSWLRHTFQSCPGVPDAVVLTPLRIGSVQHLRTLDADRFHPVWAEEAGDRLEEVVRRAAAKGDPIRILGRRIVQNPALPPLLCDTVSHICRLSIGIRAPSSTTPSGFRSAALGRLSALLGRQSTGLASLQLERLWSDRPRDRGSEQLFGWALLLLACGSEGGRSPALLDGLGLPRNTLDRCSAHLLGWPLIRAVQQSRVVRLRFDEWRRDTVAFGSSDAPPPATVRDLSRMWFCDSSTLRMYWKRAMPLECRPKQLLSWSMLFWALRERQRGREWDAIAARTRCRRRTMERHSRVLAGCTLGAAVQEPALAVRAFWGWVAQVWRPQ